MIDFITHALLAISWLIYLALIVLEGDIFISTVIFRMVLGVLIGCCLCNSLWEVLK